MHIGLDGQNVVVMEQARNMQVQCLGLYLSFGCASAATAADWYVVDVVKPGPVVTCKKPADGLTPDMAKQEGYVVGELPAPFTGIWVIERKDVPILMGDSKEKCEVAVQELTVPKQSR